VKWEKINRTVFTSENAFSNPIIFQTPTSTPQHHPGFYTLTDTVKVRMPGWMKGYGEVWF
jgi:hypothetical protein